ncbi:MAG TPA: hypothetical protein VEZ90_04800 [Blastocatellia bacterium]|nr:hypothetical protein [Blastocatellia bacterium]
MSFTLLEDEDFVTRTLPQPVTTAQETNRLGSIICETCPRTLLTVNPYHRLDQIWYYPSANPFSDQTQTTRRQRHLLNAGVRVDLTYNKGLIVERTTALRPYPAVKLFRDAIAQG